MTLKITISALSLIVLSAFRSSAPVDIRIQTPVEKAVYKALDTIWIKALVSAPEALHNVNLKVVTADNGEVIYSKNIHTHGNSARVNEYFINPLTEKKELRLSIQTTGHDGGETGNQWINFSTAAAGKSKSAKKP
mgnify:CR=1 FL=1